MRALFIASTRLGDAILSTGVLSWMLDQGYQVTVACGPVAVPLFKDVPGVDRVVAMRKGPMGAHWRHLWAETVGTKWDLVVDLRGSAFSWVVRTGERRFFRTLPGDAHRLEQLHSALQIPAGAPRLWIDSESEDRAASLLPDRSRPILAVCPTANWPPKAWPTDRFLDLIGRLTEPGGRLEGAHVVVAGGPSERDLAEPVLNSVPEDRRIDLVGTEPLMTLAACLRRVDLVVANDSGLMHLAAAAGAPTLGLFGPSRETHYAPRGPRTAWVRSNDTASALLSRSGEVAGAPGALMGGLSVETVYEGAVSLLDQS